MNVYKIMEVGLSVNTMKMKKDNKQKLRWNGFLVSLSLFNFISYADGAINAGKITRYRPVDFERQQKSIQET